MSYTPEELGTLEALLLEYRAVAERYAAATAESRAFYERHKEERDRLDAEFIAARDAAVEAERRMMAHGVPLVVAMLRRQQDAARAGEAR